MSPDSRHRGRTWLRRGALGAVGAGALVLLASCVPPPTDVTFTVTVRLDLPDADPGDGVCEATPGLGDCTLRAAVTEANLVSSSVRVWIELGAGDHQLTRPGADDTNVGGDLDITSASPRVWLRAPLPGARLVATGGDGVLDIDADVFLTGVSVAGGDTGVRVRSGASLNWGAGAAVAHGDAGLDVDAGGSARAYNVTLAANAGPGASVDGALDLEWSTVTANGSGGLTGTGTVDAVASLVGDQDAGTDCAVTVTSTGWNRDTDGTCALAHADDATVAGLDLSASADGPLPVRRPAPGSAVVDVIPPGPVCTATLTDATGRARPVGGGCEPGAGESDPALRLVVDSASDAVDADPGDGRCETAGGACTLRAAAGEVNAWSLLDASAEGPHTIVLAADPVLSIAGRNDDQNVTGDVDVRAEVVLEGDGHVISAAGLDRALDLHQPARLVDVEVRDGSAGAAARGGGIRSMLGLELSGVTLTANQAGAGGGAIRAFGALDVVDSTITSNAGGTGTGGVSLAVLGVEVGTVSSSTIVANTGGVAVGAALESTAPLTVRGSILAAALPPAAGPPVCSGTVTSGDHNVVADASCGAAQPGDQTGVDPLVGPLADNGGPTPTRHPVWGSPAIDAVPAGTGGAPTPLCDDPFDPDQRGFPRPAGAGCDAGAVEAHGAAVVVTHTGDDIDAAPGDGVCQDAGGAPGACSLRAAVMETNTWPDATIVVTPGLGTLTLTRVGNDDTALADDLDIAGDRTILGNGATLLVDGAGRALDVLAGAHQVHVADLAITGATDTAIRNQAGLTLERVDVHDNQGAGPGGILHAAGDLVVRDSQVRDNTSGGLESTWGNIGIVAAGGIDVQAGTVLVERSTVSGNGGQFGAGMRVMGGAVVVESSTLVDNVTYQTIQLCHPIYSFCWTEPVPNEGGAIRVAGTASVEVRRSTVVDNVATGGGRALHVAAGGSLGVVGSIVDSAGDDCAGAVTSLGWNRGGDATCGLTATGDAAPAGLAHRGLGDHGGPTPTLLFDESADVIDVIPVGTAGVCDATTPTDQRGAPRPQGEACDVGATDGGSVGEPNLWVVDTDADAPDAVPGDGLCATAAAECSLRAATAEANADPGFDYVDVAGHDVVVVGSDLVVSDSLVLFGGGGSIDGGGAVRALLTYADDLWVSDLTLTGGSASNGAGISHVGQRTVLVGVTVTSNEALGGAGGGIWASTGELLVVDSVVSANRATAGGGIAVGSARVEVRRSSLVDNVAERGGGLAATNGLADVLVEASTLTGNEAITGNALSSYSSADVTVVASSLVRNGGDHASLTGAPAATIDRPSGSTISVLGSVLDGAGSECAGAGTVVSQGWNLAADTTCALAAPGDQQVADTGLAPRLADDPQALQRLWDDSPGIGAIPAGTAWLCSAAVDQTGATRPAGQPCDVGALEGGMGSAAPAPATFVVDHAGDAVDVDPGDGVCATAAATCTLRAALVEANAAASLDIIEVASGIDPVLTVDPALSASFTGDLDVWAPVVLDGVGATVHAAPGHRVLWSAADVRLERVALTGGEAVEGGAVVHVAGSLETENVSIAGNAAINAGGVVVRGGTAHLRFTTIADNTAARPDGYEEPLAHALDEGLALSVHTGASATVEASILAGPGIACRGAVTSVGYVVDPSVSCGTGAVGDVVGEPALLVAVGSDGIAGPYATSPAVGLVPAATAGLCDGTVATDLTGGARPQGGACDAGATEPVAPPAPPAPIEFVVDRADDAVDAAPGDGVCAAAGGGCTLRAAIDEVNRRPGGGTTVRIATGVDPHLTLETAGEIDGYDDDANLGGDLDAWEPFALDGDGATISSEVTGSVLTALGTAVGVTDLTVADAWGGVGVRGGALDVADVTVEGQALGGTWALDARSGLVAVTDSVFTANVAGAVRSERGTTTITGTEIVGNGLANPGVVGGAVRVVSGDVTVTDSLVQGNVAGVAGAFAVESGSLSVLGSTIDGNSNSSSSADGVIRVAAGASFDLRRSTVSANTAKDDGGALWVAGSAVVEQTTLSGNTAVNGVAAGEGGTAFVAAGGSLVVRASTVVAPAHTGTGVATAFDGTGALHLVASAVQAAAPTTACDTSLARTSGGFNVVGDVTCQIAGPNDLAGANALLGPLADNGGPTLTHLPEPTSPVLDRVVVGQVGLCDASLPTDQRGEARPAGAGCDSGAVEAGAGPPAPSFVVDTAADAVDATPGDGTCADALARCTLRAAVQESNATPGGAEVTIAAGIDPTLALAGTGEDLAATGDLDVTAPLRLAGDGDSRVSAADLDRVFEVHGAVLIADGLVLADGAATGSSGGAVRSIGSTLWFESVTVRDSTAEYGGGLSVGGGGGAYLDRVTVTANQSGSNGGGLSAGAPVTLVDSTISSNTAGASGGGVAATAPLAVVRSTLSGNAAGSNSLGGAISSSGTGMTVVVDSSTLVANRASSGAAIQHAGNLPLRITRSTITANVGGVAVEASSTASVRLAATVISTANGSGRGCGGSIQNDGFNVVSDLTCGGAMLPGVPLVSPVGANGGPTATAPLYADSPGVDAIPAGTVGLCDGATVVDQRGAARPAGGACDSGAVEGTLAALPPLALTVTSGADQVDAAPGDGVCLSTGGACTLRAAITETNLRPTADTITLAADVTLTRVGRNDDNNATGDLDVRDRLVVEGAGHTVDANDLDRVLHHHTLDLELHDLTVTDGRDQSFVGGFGGGVFTSGHALLLDGVTVTANEAVAGSGGGVYASTGVMGLSFGHSLVLEIVDSTITANTTTTGTYGGGIYTGSATTTITGSLIEGNSARYGGGIVGTVTLVGSTVRANAATDGSGGGIYGDAVVTDSLVEDNTANGEGGGISGTYTLTGSTVQGNSAVGPGGGLAGTGTVTDSEVLANTAGYAAGIYAGSASGNPTTTILRSTIAGNVASGTGARHSGGIWAHSPVVIDDSTISGNRVESSNGTASGGGLHARSNVTVRNSTFSANESVAAGAPGAGAAIAADGTWVTIAITRATFAGNEGAATLGVGTMTIRGTIVAGTVGGTACVGAKTSLTWNVVHDATCGLVGTGDQQGVDALLGPLADNGGATLTHLPGVGSPARDQIVGTVSGLCGLGVWDQRGVPRPQGPACDVGATEQ